MSAERQVLVVDHEEGALLRAMVELDLLGLRVVWVSSSAAALEFVRSSPGLALLIASASALPETRPDFLDEIRLLCPGLRTIRGTTRSGAALSRAGSTLDSLVAEPFRPDELREAISVLLFEHFYPKPIAEAVVAAGFEVLGSLGTFRVERSVFPSTNLAGFSNIGSAIAFSGGAEGQLMLSASAAHAQVLYAHFLPTIRTGNVSIDQLEDFIGELCNRILGRINAFFVLHGLSIQHGTPGFVCSAGRPRCAARHPSFGVTFATDELQLSLDYFLIEFDSSTLRAVRTDAVVTLGEVHYL